MANAENEKNNITDMKEDKGTAAEQGRPADPKELIRKLGKGTLALECPIRARSKDVKELHYDFSVLTGREYADAMDRDGSVMNMVRITNNQALYLFAAAAAKQTEDVDATDIAERIGIQDCIKAVQLAQLFFAASMREANNRITND